jgi:cellulase
MPGPELIASGTEVAPQLLTFGTISGSPATGGGASKPASSSKAAAPASSTLATVASSSKAAASISSTIPVVASSSAIAGAVTSSAAATPIVSSSPNASVTEAPIKSSAAPALTPPVITAIFSTGPVDLLSTLATSVRPQPSEGASSGSIKEYAQCGGNGFQGTGACAEGLECKNWNPYYSQCIKPEGGAAPAPAKPSTTEVAAAPSASAPAPAQPTIVAPTDNEPKEKTYTLETFVAFLEKNAGSSSAAAIRRMIQALQ